MEKRFNTGELESEKVHVVIDLPIDKYNERPDKKHQIVRIQAGGMISDALARTWCTQIADQLNSFDVANATVAKLT